jgi:hypothetical protein
MGKKDFKEESKEMSLEEAKSYRTSLYKPTIRPLSDKEKRDKFRLFWSQSKKKYGRPKELESLLWIHLKATKHDEPENFEKGLKHFGLKKLAK